MATRYCGDAIITIRYQSSGAYAGTVRVLDRPAIGWHFDDLYPPMAGFDLGSDSPEAYDRMARAALSFVTYYTTGNLGADMPDWVPPAEIADAIDAATSWARDDAGEPIVFRSRAAARVG